jgi:hypothetical protein
MLRFQTQEHETKISNYNMRLWQAQKCVFYEVPFSVIIINVTQIKECIEELKN